MLKALRLTLCVLCLGITSLYANESQDSFPKEPVAIQIIHEQEGVQPGHPFWVAVQIKIDDHWHAYWKNPGDAGMAPQVTWNLPEGFSAGPLVWPTPTRFSLGPVVGFGYENELVLLTEITPAASYTKDSVALSAEIRWVVCNDETCLPGDSQASLNLPVSTTASKTAEAYAEIFKKTRSQLPAQHQKLTVERSNGLIQLAIEDNTFEKVDAIDFFPEERQAIDYKEKITLQSDSPHHYKISMKETAPASNLKGVMVLKSGSKNAAYHVDLPLSGNSEISMTTPVVNSTRANLSTPSQNSFEFTGGLGLALIMAFAGGFLLNLMPCVLPVISFKVLSFIKLAGQSRRLVFQHGLAFSLGVMLSFWVLAALLLGLQTYGRSVGWGFQLQEPIFVATLAASIFLFALSLFGLFEIGTSLIGAASQAQQISSNRNALLGSFLGGILATAVATPCTGPFLGTAVGYAVTLPASQAMLIFTSLGLGMCWPYLALAAFPSLLRFLPKPGPWMITFKELMGFLMMGSVLWLIWVFSAQTGSFSVSLFLAALFFLAIAGWIYGRWSTPMQKPKIRSIARLFSFAFLGAACYVVVLSTSPWAEAMGGVSTHKQNSEITANEWEAFSPERVAQLRAEGTPVFIDFTAKWCLICQANHVILSTDEVSQKFSDKGVVKMKADWTKTDETIAAELRKFGRNSVPLYVLYGAEEEKEPQILPQVLTSDTILDALEHLADSL